MRRERGEHAGLGNALSLGRHTQITLKLSGGRSASITVSVTAAIIDVGRVVPAIEAVTGRTQESLSMDAGAAVTRGPPLEIIALKRRRPVGNFSSAKLAVGPFEAVFS